MSSVIHSEYMFLFIKFFIHLFNIDSRSVFTEDSDGHSSDFKQTFGCDTSLEVTEQPSEMKGSKDNSLLLNILYLFMYNARI